MTAFHPGLGQVCSFCGRDLWEVRRYVTATAIICDACVETARSVLAASDGSGEREVHFPPRVFGDEPYAGASDDIVGAFDAAIGTGRDPEMRALHLEAADEVGPLIDQAGHQYRHMGAGVRVDRVRFVSADRAEVRFTVLVGGRQGFSFEGRTVRRDGTWLVTRDTMMAILPPSGAGSHMRLTATRRDEPGEPPVDE